MSSNYYDDEGGRRQWVVLAGIAAVVLIGGYLLLTRESAPPVRSAFATTAAPVPTEAPSTTDRESTGDDESTSTTTQPGSDSNATSTTTEPIGGSTTTTIVASLTPVGPAPTPGSIAPGTQAADLGFPASPDGAPLPVVVIYDTETTTLTGAVPSQAAIDRLAALAVANSQNPDAAVVNNLIVNDKVPPNVGVRVIEMNSPRFPEGAATVTSEHSKQLDRVVSVMKALPNVSVLVIGHADQRGDDATNFAMSDQRARAVVNYLIYLGVEPTRVSSRAAGETELLTVSDDATSLALNRRTEFIFYGVLVD